MNDLIRPALYQAYHEILPVLHDPMAEAAVVDLVGPVCETGDFFARDRTMPKVKEGDLVAILDTGAYGMSLSSNYNSRPRPAEVLVEGKRSRLIRRRETIRDLIGPETRFRLETRRCPGSCAGRTADPSASLGMTRVRVHFPERLF